MTAFRYKSMLVMAVQKLLKSVKTY